MKHIIYIQLGWNSLIYAAFHGRLEVVKILLEHGANIEEKNNNGKLSLFMVGYNIYIITMNLFTDYNVKSILHIINLIYNTK